MKQLLSLLFVFISGISLAQDRFLDLHNFGALNVIQINKWVIYYKNGEKTDSTLYAFEFDSAGKMVAEKWGFSYDLRNYTQSRNGKIFNQDGEPVLSGNPPLNGYDQPFLFNNHKAYGIQKTKQWYTMGGDIRTIEIWHQVNENAHGILLTHKWRSKIEFYYGYIQIDSCSNLYFDGFDMSRDKRASRRSRKVRGPEYTCAFMQSSWPVIHLIEWVEKKKVTFAVRYEYIFVK